MRSAGSGVSRRPGDRNERGRGEAGDISRAPGPCSLFLLNNKFLVFVIKRLNVELQTSLLDARCERRKRPNLKGERKKDKFISNSNQLSLVSMTLDKRCSPNSKVLCFLTRKHINIRSNNNFYLLKELAVSFFTT